MIEKIAQINAAISGFIWGVPAMICIIGIGLLLTIKTRCIQVRKFKVAIKNTIRNVDICTKYSSVQFLVILLEAGEDNIHTIINRISAF